MTVMAAGGRTSPRKAQVQTPHATYLSRGVMDRTLSLCTPPPAATRSLRLRLPRGEFDADEIRHDVRQMVARSRHPAGPTGAEVERQQADDPPHAKGQPWLSENEGQARRSVFGLRWATCQGSRTFRDSEPMSDGYFAVSGTPLVRRSRNQRTESKWT